jgi:HNH endonuclease
MVQIAKTGAQRKTKKVYYGSQAPNWRGGRYIKAEGYVVVYNPTHPYKNNFGYIREHRLVMEQHLGRYLKPDEYVHHKDGNKQNNHISNLELITPSKHSILHHPKGKVVKDMSNRICFFCLRTSEQIHKHPKSRPH